MVNAAAHPGNHGLGSEYSVFNSQPVQLRMLHADPVIYIFIENGKHDAGQRSEQDVVKLHHVLVETGLTAPCIERREEELNKRVPA